MKHSLIESVMFVVKSKHLEALTVMFSLENLHDHQVFVPGKIASINQCLAHHPSWSSEESVSWTFILLSPSHGFKRDSLWAPCFRRWQRENPWQALHEGCGGTVPLFLFSQQVSNSNRFDTLRILLNFAGGAAHSILGNKSLINIAKQKVFMCVCAVWGAIFFACECTESRVDKGTIFLKATFF